MSSYWKGRRVICTGGSGFLGSHLVDALRRLDCKPFVPRSGQYDLRSEEGVINMFNDAMALWGQEGCQTLFHLAALCGGIGFNQKFPARLWHDNLLMGIHLINTAAFCGVEKFVGVGTVCSYPKHTPTPFNEQSLWDGYPEETNAPYGLAKKALLVGLQAYGQERQLEWTYVMPTNLYGPRDHFGARSHVIPALIDKFLHAKGEPTVSVWGTGTPTRDFLYVKDCAAALLLAGELLSGGPYNIGSGREISIEDLARLIADAVGFRGQICFDAFKPDGQPRRVLDSSKFMKLTEWSPQVGFEQGLTQTVQWYRDLQQDGKPELTGVRAESGGSPSV